MRLNKIVSNNDRLKFWSSSKQYKFLDYTQGISWVGTESFELHNWQKDGKNWKEERYQLLWGTYFFLADEVVEHQHRVRNILDCISALGGLWSLLFSLLSNMFLIINRKWFVAKLLRHLYFEKKSCDDHDCNESIMAQKAKTMKFTWKNKLAEYRMKIQNLFRCKFKATRQDRLFLKGE